MDNLSVLLNSSAQPETQPAVLVPSPLPGWFTSFLIAYFTVRHVEAAIALVGNAWVMVAILKYEYLQTPTNVLVFSLSAGDLFAGTGPPLDTLVYLSPFKAYWKPVCLFNQVLAMMCIQVNVFSTLFISIDRVLYIAMPFRYLTWVTMTRSISITSLMWVYSFASAVITILTARHRLLPFTLCSYPVFIHPGVFWGFCISSFVLASLTTFICYGAIGCLAWKHSRRIKAEVTSVGGNQDQPGSVARQNRISKIMNLVLGLYFVLYVPGIIFACFIRPDSSFGLQIGYTTSLLLWFVSSWINPIIYATRWRDFRRSFRKMFNLKIRPIDADISAATDDST